jgi:hypothetical protein
MSKTRFLLSSAAHASLAALAFAACRPPNPEPVDTAAAARAVTAQDRLTACGSDPRVTTGLVAAPICAGADIFFRETFNGNGRTCGTCHPMANNTTIDVPFIQSLPATDPLFVFERVPALAHLETPDLRRLGGILENVDGFDDPTHKSCAASRTFYRSRPASPPTPATARPTRPSSAPAGAATARPATARSGSS